MIIIGPAHPLRGGGMSTFNERLAKAIQDNGHQVILYTFSLQYPGFLFPGTSQLTEAPAPVGLDIRVLINSVNPFNWIKVGNMLRKENADIVIVRYWLPFMGPCLGTLLRLLKKNGRSKVVCIADNILPHEKRVADNLFTRYFIKPVDAFITMSRKVMEDLKKFNALRPVKYVPHPLYDNFGEIMDIAVAREKLQLDMEGKFILFFGFIRKYKGLDILLDAIKLIYTPGSGYWKESKENPRPKLIIAGEFYGERAVYENQIRQLGIEDALILKTSFIPDEEIKYYFCAADLVVQPYRNATQSGVTPLAYHFEIPMLVTNVGGLPEYVPDGISGIVAEPDASAIANGIKTFFEKPAGIYLEGLRDEKKKFSWDLFVDEILELAE